MNCLIDLIGCGAAIVALMFLCNGKKEKKKKHKNHNDHDNHDNHDDHDIVASNSSARFSEGISIPKKRLADHSYSYGDFPRTW